MLAAHCAELCPKVSLVITVGPIGGIISGVLWTEAAPKVQKNRDRLIADDKWTVYDRKNSYDVHRDDPVWL